jgi:hypothetical protein
MAVVRQVVPYLDSGDHVPDITALADAVRIGVVAREVLSGEMAGVDGA